jgi:hypothetical protein
MKRTTFTHLKKRWLYHLSQIFVYVIPGIMILEKTFMLKNPDKLVAVSLTGMSFGLVYLCFLSRKVKDHIKEMRPGSAKVILENILPAIPFITVGCIFYMVEHALEGAMMTALCIAASIAMGSVLRGIEYALNKEYFYNLAIEEAAHKQIELEARIKKLKAEREESLL